MKLKVTSDFYLGHDLIKAGSIIDVDKNTLKRCLDASVGTIEAEDGETDGSDSDDAPGTGADDTRGSKASAKNRRK